jgi:hypothetical protein
MAGGNAGHFSFARDRVPHLVVISEPSVNLTSVRSGT